MTCTLLGADGKPYLSEVPGTLGGHRRTRIYGRLDCPSALRAIARGGYVTHRVFFADEATAIAAGYRPCATCLPDAYQAWKQRLSGRKGGASRNTASIDSTREAVIALAAVSIRDLDDRVKDRLRIRAARHGRSMEAEIRAILTDAVSEPGEAEGLFQALLDRFGELGGVDLELPPRTAQPRAAEFDQ